MITQKDLRRLERQRQQLAWEHSNGRYERGGSTTGMVCAVRDGAVIDEFGRRSQIKAGQTWWSPELLLETRDKEILELFGCVNEDAGSSLPTPAAATGSIKRTTTTRPSWYL